MLTLIFPLKVKMPFSGRLAYVLMRFLRTRFTIAVYFERRCSGAKPPAQRSGAEAAPITATTFREAGRFFIMHLPTAFKRFRCELNRKKSKFERKRLVSRVTPKLSGIVAITSIELRRNARLPCSVI